MVAAICQAIRRAFATGSELRSRPAFPTVIAADLPGPLRGHLHDRHHAFQHAAVLGAVHALRFASPARSARPSGMDAASAQRRE
jgi:hypothetical protein